MFHLAKPATGPTVRRAVIAGASESMDAAAQERETLTSEQLAAEVSPLAEVLGSPAGLASWAGLAELVDLPKPETFGAARLFVERFHERLLEPVELPGIRDAYFHAQRGEVRELVALDRRLGRSYGRSAFAEASRHVGRIQLRRLRPMRDRTVQRYLAAVESGEATGWHVVVFGVLLAAFSMPLRQGLAHYATRTRFSLLESATAGLGAAVAMRDLEAAQADSLPAIARAVASALPPMLTGVR